MNLFEAIRDGASWVVDTTAAFFRAAPSTAVSQPLYRQTAIYPFFQWLAGVPDPDEVLRRTGRQRYDLRELLRDAEVSQAIDTRRDAAIATPWRLEGGDERGVKFVTDELAPVIEPLIRGCWEARLYGYSVAEVVYRPLGPFRGAGIAGVHFPPFEWFRPLPDGSLRYFPMTGEGGVNGIECDIQNKFFLTACNPTYRNPYGEALLSVLYWPVTWRLQGWQLWLDFLETFGAPIVVGRTGNYEKFVEAMQAQGIKRTVGWQPTGDADAITSITANATGEFDKMNEALNATIQRVVLGQTLTSQIGKGGGSYAAAKVHEQVRDDKRRADVRMIVGTVQRVVDSLWLQNAFAGTPPRFEMQDDVGLETERAERDLILTGMGVRFKEKYYTERYDLEPDDFSLTDPTPQPALADRSTGNKRTKGALAALLSSRPRFTPEQQVIEDAITPVLDQLDEVIAHAEIEAAVRAATSPADLETRLAALLADADPSKQREVLERALFAADILGYAHANNRS